MPQSKITRIALLAAALAACGASDDTAGAVEITAQNVTFNDGQTAQLQVTWTSTTSLLDLTTQFQIKSAAGPAGGPAGGVKFSVTSGAPPVPPLTDPNYVFYNDSFALINFPNVNPASVSTTAWTNDTYEFADAANSDSPYVQNGSRLWTILNIRADFGVLGDYYVQLISGEYNTTQTATLTGGLITIVPEPDAWVLGTATFTAILAILLHRKRVDLKNRQSGPKPAFLK